VIECEDASRRARRKPKPQEQPPLSAHQVREAMAILSHVRQSLLSADPDIAEDEKLFLDMLDGEGGDAVDVLRAAMRASLEAEAVADGIAGRADKLEERKARFRRRAEGLKSAVVQAMQSIGLPRLEDPEFTLRIQPGQRTARIIDEDLLPGRFVKTTKEPLRRDITAALKAGEVVAGAALSNGAPIVVVSRR
jgi:hypothetical protein